MLAKREGVVSQLTPTLKPRSILIVDDEPVLCLFLGRLLTELGYHIAGTAANGIEAIEKTRELQPDLVILDNAMPLMDGLDAAGKILSERNVPIILCSGLVGGDLHARAMRVGIHTLMPKPFTLGQLEEALHGVETARNNALAGRREMLPSAA